MISLTLPYPVSANRYWKAITIPGRTMMAPSKEAKQYREQVLKLARAAGVRQPIAGRVALHIELYPQRPQDWAKRQRLEGATWDDSVRCIDLDNANKVLLDAIKTVVIDDDRWVRRLSSERMEPDELGARVVLHVKQIEAPTLPQLFGVVAADMFAGGAL